MPWPNGFLARTRATRIARGSATTTRATASGGGRHDDYVREPEALTDDPEEVEIDKAGKQRESTLDELLLLASLRQLPAAVVVAEAPSGRIVLANAQVDAILRGDDMPDRPPPRAAPRRQRPRRERGRRERGDVYGDAVYQCQYARMIPASTYATRS
jgi:hypothetical protein